MFRSSWKKPQYHNTDVDLDLDLNLVTATKSVRAKASPPVTNKNLRLTMIR